MLRQAKINMMVIIGMMVAMGTVAFTTKEKSERLLAPQWFEYTPSGSADLTTAMIPSNYSPVGTVDPDPTLCGGSTDLCAIKAETDLSNPSQPLPLIENEPVELAIESYFQGTDNDQFLREKN